MSFKYDVALSFAGEDREYVDKVANNLRELRVSVFYDKFEEVNLWGKNLYEYLEDVYFKQCKYTVMFISEAYAKKLWPKKERESAQARAFQEKGEYILPARFDNSKVPGILPTIHYIDLREKTPEEFSEIIKSKVMAPLTNTLKLVDFYPKVGQKIRREDIKNIYLKFNNPIDRRTQIYIKNYLIQGSVHHQWNVSGWIEFTEGDTRLNWHIDEKSFDKKLSYLPIKYDYPIFEIEISSNSRNSKLKDIHGNEFPYFVIPVKIIDE